MNTKLTVLAIIIFILIVIFCYSNREEIVSYEKDIRIKIIEYEGFWNEQTAENNPKWLFVYGDNDLRNGTGGQAIIRDQPNSIGIPTKKSPGNKINSYYTDEEYDENIIKIRYAINNIRWKLNTGLYTHLVFPHDGLGTGLAQLNKRAPRTYNFLKHSIKNFSEEIRQGSSKNLTFLQIP